MIGALLPAAMGIALSPIPIIVVVIVLGTPNARKTGSFFALGWILGFTAVSVVAVLVFEGGRGRGHGHLDRGSPAPAGRRCPVHVPCLEAVAEKAASR